MFKREDIKAGYLLHCTHLKEGRQFNMTVIPCRRSLPLLAPEALQTKDGDLACCNKGMDWLPLTAFDSNLVHANTYRIDEVWGPAAPMRLMDNNTIGRERLWLRDDTKRMTLEEIEKALGHKVKIVEAGKPAPGPDLFKKSSMYAGMVVELRSGRKRLVVPSNEGLLLVGESQPAPTFGHPNRTARAVDKLANYVDGLTIANYAELNPDKDIVKVWDRINHAGYVDDAFTTNTANRHLVWQRDDAKRMTLEEIGKVLGHKVEVVERITIKI